MIGRKILQEPSAKEQKEVFDSLELLGAAEVGKVLGWHFRKVSKYAERGVLPDPVGRINNRPVWTKRQIDRFMKRRGLKSE